MAKIKLRGEVVTLLGKTAKVKSQRLKRHALYQKVVKRHKNFLADCADIAVGVGDIVEITETAPISRRKTWKITKVVKTR